MIKICEKSVRYKGTCEKICEKSVNGSMGEDGTCEKICQICARNSASNPVFRFLWVFFGAWYVLHCVIIAGYGHLNCSMSDFFMMYIHVYYIYLYLHLNIHISV